MSVSRKNNYDFQTSQSYESLTAFLETFADNFYGFWKVF